MKNSTFFKLSSTSSGNSDIFLGDQLLLAWPSHPPPTVLLICNEHSTFLLSQQAHTSTKTKIPSNSPLSRLMNASLDEKCGIYWAAHLDNVNSKISTETTFPYNYWHSQAETHSMQSVPVVKWCDIQAGFVRNLFYSRLNNLSKNLRRFHSDMTQWSIWRKE